ncbi:MAG TPA: type IV pilus twitching motility protein PilT [Gaiellaceae bacterium]|nr:type IV pilus twitching motility protein PilT [Gaiellaceae bacterium]
MDLDGLLARLIDLGGSDMHLKIASPAMARVDGELQPMEERLLTESDLETVLTLVSERTPAKREHFYVSGELDTAYLAEGLGRFRVNGYRQRGSISLAFRFIPKEIPSFAKLGLPDGVGRLAEEHRGLVLVTGATGSGKSTTLAAMVNAINRSRKQHIVTIEDPIEFVHDDWGCIVNQREVGLDTDSYMEALRRVLRQDPDVILIGELRDEESAKAALQAAESGHFVLSTMHTLDAAETIGRLVELFPAGKQDMVRQILAGVLRGVISQRLLPKAGGGRVAAVEVMVNTARVADLIRDGETDKLTEAIEDGEFHQMQSFSQHLVQLVLDGLVEEEVAGSAASNRHDFELAVQHALKRQRAAEKQAAAAAEAEAAEAEKAAAEELDPDSQSERINGNGSGLRVASTEQ